MNNKYLNVAFYIASERKKQNLSLRALEEISGVNSSYISRIEHGQLVSDKTIQKLLEALVIDEQCINENMIYYHNCLELQLRSFCTLACADDIIKSNPSSADSLLILLLQDIMNIIRNYASYDKQLSLSKDSIKILGKLENDIQMLDNFQQGAYYLISAFDSISKNDFNRFNKFLNLYDSLPFQKYSYPYRFLLEGYGFMKEKYYAKAVIILSKTKSLFSDASLYNWCIIIDCILYKIAVTIKDIALKEELSLSIFNTNTNNNYIANLINTLVQQTLI